MSSAVPKKISKEKWLNMCLNNKEEYYKCDQLLWQRQVPFFNSVKKVALNVKMATL